MNVKITKKSWSEQEKVYLSLGHKMGASLKTLSIVLNRTETSLNKALERLGIRQYGAKRGKKSRLDRPFMVTPQNFRERIEAYNHEQDQATFLSTTKIENEKAVFPSPWIVFPECHVQPLPFWSDLDYVISFLKRKGYKIQSHNVTQQVLGGVKIEFYLNGVPMSAAQLLVHANRLRLEQGLEPFYVESITEH